MNFVVEDLLRYLREAHRSRNCTPAIQDACLEIRYSLVSVDGTVTQGTAVLRDGQLNPLFTLHSIKARFPIPLPSPAPCLFPSDLSHRLPAASPAHSHFCTDHSGVHLRYSTFPFALSIQGAGDSKSPVGSAREILVRPMQAQARVASIGERSGPPICTCTRDVA